MRRWLRVLPDGVLEEVDLELDVQRSVDGIVLVRDRDEFGLVRATWPMPDEVVAEAEATCQLMRELVELRAEPFGKVGPAWLERFLAETGNGRA